MLLQVAKRGIKTIIILLTAVFSALMVYGTSYSQILADTADYQINIGDVFAEPGQIIEIPIQVKNLNPLAAFLIRFTYDSTIIRPYYSEAQPDRRVLDYFRNSRNLDAPDVVYDSLILTGHGLSTLYIDSSGRYCEPPHDDDTISNVFAYHNPNDDSMHVETVFLLFLPTIPPLEQCHLDYWSRPILTPEEDTVKTIAYILFRVEPDAIPGTISDVTVGDYAPSSPDDPESDYRVNQFTDTLAMEYIIPIEGLGFGQIHIEEYIPYCGNIDGLAGINILDVVFLINYIYKNGTVPDPLILAEVDGITPINILDVVYLINFIYKDGSNPACP
ncbi:MAG TPA: hypothetical protein ENL22_02620 [candidate division Zixibacteria bacterium]|nr:hypothetical protein [candidate division Zixibacteria bacterium]